MGTMRTMAQLSWALSQLLRRDGGRLDRDKPSAFRFSPGDDRAATFGTDPFEESVLVLALPP